MQRTATGRTAIEWKQFGNTWYNAHRDFSIERLPNGFYRLYRYGSGLASLHNALSEATTAATMLYSEAPRRG